MNADLPDPAPKPQAWPRRMTAQTGKVGLAVLLWFLGVPGLLVLAYLIFA